MGPESRSYTTVHEPIRRQPINADMITEPIIQIPIRREQNREVSVIDIPRKQKEKEPQLLSFDLRIEQQSIKRYLAAGLSPKAVRDGSISNFRGWAKEYIGKIPVTHYYWELKEEDGGVRLWHPGFGYADDMAEKAITLRPNAPTYEKQRNQIELDVTRSMQGELNQAEVGDTYVWVSPPPEEDTEEEVYGGYTMTHVYEVAVNAEGKRVFKGRDIQNNLSNGQHVELMNEVMDEDVLAEGASSLDILSSYFKIPKTTSFRDLEAKIRTKEHRTMGSQFEEQQFDDILNAHESELQDIYLMLQANQSPQAIVQKFRTWADTVEAEWAHLKGIKPNTSDAMASLRSGGGAGSGGGSFGGGSCGAGVGFGDGGSGGSGGSGAVGMFGYEASTYASKLSGSESYMDDPDLCRCGGNSAHFHCPGKKERQSVSGQSVAEDCKAAIVVGKGIKKCKSCGTEAICK